MGAASAPPATAPTDKLRSTQVRGGGAPRGVSDPESVGILSSPTGGGCRAEEHEEGRTPANPVHHSPPTHTMSEVISLYPSGTGIGHPHSLLRGAPDGEGTGGGCSAGGNPHSSRRDGHPGSRQGRGCPYKRLKPQVASNTGNVFCHLPDCWDGLGPL